jgi:protein-S-isoprenylcysteine O-methyltransferase Ste14
MPLAPEMLRSIRKRMVQIVLFTAVWGVLLFASAGRPDYIRGWICLGLFVFFAAASAILVLRYNPEVAAARSKLHSDAKGFDKVFAVVYTLLQLALPVVAGLDAVRYGWSSMSFEAVYPGALLYLLAAAPVTWAMVSNPFLETMVRIQEERGHRVVTTGPYRYVRHPMYVGIILQMVATPLVLGSWWSFVPAAVIAILFVWRTAKEDGTLRNELSGYEEYAQQTRYRLLPGIW